MAGPLDLMKKDQSAAFTIMELEDENKEENMPGKMLEAATEEILDVLGLNHDKKEELQGALKNFIKACEYMEDDNEEY